MTRPTDDISTHNVWTAHPCGCEANDDHDAGQEIEDSRAAAADDAAAEFGMERARGVA
jgi:hypothetical protein